VVGSLLFELANLEIDWFNQSSSNGPEPKMECAEGREGEAGEIIH
jgi:hypothetical protein